MQIQDITITNSSPLCPFVPIQWLDHQYMNMLPPPPNKWKLFFCSSGRCTNLRFSFPDNMSNGIFTIAHCIQPAPLKVQDQVPWSCSASQVKEALSCSLFERGSGRKSINCLYLSSIRKEHLKNLLHLTPISFSMWNHFGCLHHMLHLEYLLCYYGNSFCLSIGENVS